MEIYGNPIKPWFWRYCLAKRARYARKFKYDAAERFEYQSFPDEDLGKIIGIQKLLPQSGGKPLDPKKAVVIGTIRMGYGHFRMAMAAASAAYSMGYTPYWLDFVAVKDSTASRIIHYLDGWYSWASRVSQRNKFFNKYFWEKATSEWSRPITFHASDLAITELFKNVCASLPQDIPFIAAHPWCAQAAVAAGMSNVASMVPDNYPLSFHLAEGAILAVQSASSYIGYRELRNMGPHHEILKPIPEGQIRYTGHYIDHEIVANIVRDCDRRLDRVREGKPRRILMTIGGAGAQQAIFAGVIKYLLPLVRQGKLLLMVNMGDHKDVYDRLLKATGLCTADFTLHQKFDDALAFARRLETRDEAGLHLFLFEGIMSAVYTTNILMRMADILMTKPSELAFYPVPKLFVQRVGRHEAWGAIRGAEIGDGTIETDTLKMLYQTLDIFINDADLLSLYCSNIRKNYEAGVYDGAYNVVRITEEVADGTLSGLKRPAEASGRRAKKAPTKSKKGK